MSQHTTISGPADVDQEYKNAKRKALEPEVVIFLENAHKGQMAAVQSSVAGSKDLISECDGKGRTALLLAAHGGHKEVFDFLAAEGSDAARVDWEDFDALQLAIKANHLDLAAHILDAYGDRINVTRVTKKGWNVLHDAVKSGNIDLIKRLLSLGAPINAGADLIGTPLHNACAGSSDMSEVVELLCGVDGIDLNARNDDHTTALHMACICRHTHSVKALLSHNCAVNMVARDGASPLHMAAAVGCAEAVEALLAHPDVKLLVDDDGETAIDVAKNMGNTSIQTTLQKAVASGQLPKAEQPEARQKAETLRLAGNECFRLKRFDEAARLYTKALGFAPDSHLILSNRSAAYYSLGQMREALLDAMRCVECEPSFAKGHFRKAVALFSLGNKDFAVVTLKRAAELDPENATYKKLLKEWSP